MKRLFDLVFAVLIAPFVILVMAILIIIICLETRGNPLFIQDRVGRHQRVFRFLKLRSMRVGTAQVASHEVGEECITKVGLLMRKTKLDELPQLWNVFKGEMSFVGPRPCLPIQKDVIAEREKRGVYQLRPGVTGLGQIGGYDMAHAVELAQKDAEYITEFSIKLDIMILFKTVFGAHGDAAARQ